MRIIETIRFDKPEQAVFHRCRRWLSLAESLELSEDEYKHATRIVNEPSGLVKDRLKESRDVWEKIRQVAVTRIDEMNIQLHILPELSEGIIMRPKQLAETIIQCSEDAIKDIDLLLMILSVAISSMVDMPRNDGYEFDHEGNEIDGKGPIAYADDVAIMR
ncbi:hypothetical protein CMI47_11265 [Candidatus Pacearchaeota archaeon]|nr:hypothetical protein [Candidatus Pacearchaeota archaeon]|tara:strand:- start:1237 stop:1719 length:483 start_codon:yes stop_codon:yes gene_type:complete